MEWEVWRGGVEGEVREGLSGGNAGATGATKQEVKYEHAHTCW